MTSTEMTTIKDGMRAARQQAAAGPVPTIEELRAMMETTFGGLPPVGGASYAEVDLGGVPGELAMPDAPTVTGTLLYFHGGGYCMGSIASHRRLVTSLSVTAGLRGLSVGYRLVPEHPFPAAVEDAVAAYRWLVGPGGEHPARVVVAGDSAGGGLALATLVALRDDGAPLPAGLLLLSPWTDLTCTAESLRTRAAADPALVPDLLRTRVASYVPDGDPRHPLVSPLHADLSGLPPVLVQVGEDEILFDDSAGLVQRAREAGVTADLQIWPDAFHVFQLMVGVLPEADEAVAKAAEWTDRLLDARTTQGAQ